MEILKNLFDDFGKVFSENADPIYDTPLHVIEAMWQVKWANEWVPVEEFEKDKFWTGAFMRLTNADKLESHRIVTAPDGNSGLVYRLKKHEA
jgi:RIO-like serine/threonine protein kinase